MDCPDADCLARFMEGTLEEERRSSVQEHMQQCADCRALLVDCIKAGTANVPDLPDEQAPYVQDPRHLTRGDLLGRYLVLGRLGEGGMGVVLAAYDPELDRKVALKLLHAQVEGSQGAQPRLQQEARVLARLNHGNVITVFDVGEAHGIAFVAMELVEGKTLRAWMVERPRSWREVLAVMVPAGRGLEAAHRAGVIHRDFKPDNVLLGDDGRIRVTDFGLARTTPRLEPTGLPHNLTLTMSGVAHGTPVYMSPEQLHGRAADERSDVFGYCVTLYEALCGQRPFTGTSLEELQASMTTEAVWPAQNRTPGWLFREVMRGLSLAPAQRHPSMTALLEALERAPRQRRRWTVGSISAVTFVAVLGGLLALQPDPLCTRGAVEVARAWNDAARATLEQGLRNAGMEGPDVQSVMANLDGYAQRWGHTHNEICAATHLAHAQSETLLDTRMQCLEQGLHGVEALVNRLATPADVRTDRILDAVFNLPPPQECTRVQNFGAPPPPSRPEDQQRMAEVNELLAQIKVLEPLDKLDEAAVLGEQAMSLARELGYKPLLANVLDTLISVHQRVRGSAEAERTALQAAAVGAEAHEDQVVLAALVDVMSLRVGATRPAEAADLRPWVEVAMARIGTMPLSQRIVYHQVVGQLEATRGHPHEAVAHVETAVALAGSDPDAPYHLVNAQRTRSYVYRLLEKNVEAVRSYTEMLETARTRLGAEHRFVSWAYRGLGHMHSALGDKKEAEHNLRKALELSQRVRGPNAVEMGMAAGELGYLILYDRPAEAAQLFTVCVEQLGSLEIKHYLNRGNCMNGLARAERLQGLHPQAAEHFAETLRLWGHLKADDQSLHILQAHGEMGWIHILRKEFTLAEQKLRMARSGLERRGGNSLILAATKLGLAALLQHVHGDVSQARLLAEQARKELAEKGPEGEIRWVEALKDLEEAGLRMP